MTRSPFALAALASSAVPGLDPVAVEGVLVAPGDLFEVAYVKDSQDRQWVVKAPRTPAAGAALEDVATLSGLLGKRLEVAMPMVRGQAVVPEGRACVYLRVPGRPLDFGGLPPGGLAGEVGRALAHIHNVEHLVLEEAGRPVYDAEAHRRRQLSELDRAAGTGHVPTHLLTRWEGALEAISLWRFAPTVVHGTFVGANVLASFDDDDDATTGRVRGVLAWEEARVGDPADDFGELVARCSPAALDAVMEAYAQSRVERPDGNLLRRARLAAEMRPVRSLLHAMSSGEGRLVERAARSLRLLDEQIWAEDEQRAADRAQEREQAEADAAAAAEVARQRAAAELAEVAERTEHERERQATEQDAAREAARAAGAEWDATAAHDPFPPVDPAPTADAATASDEAAASPDEVAEPIDVVEPAEDDTVARGAETANDPADDADDADDRTDADAVTPLPVATEDSGAFEIEEVEALPEPGDDEADDEADDETTDQTTEEAAFDDRHEGASDYVRIDPERRSDDRS
ncbi:MAG: aminoglycoside phosphotransferase [Terracoccus sp.]